MRVACFLRGVPGKEPLLRLRPKQAEKRGTEHDARDHLRDNLWLSETRRDGSNHAAKDQDDRELQKKLNGEFEVTHGARCLPR